MKYIELVKGLFTTDHEARAKQADPYVAYSKEADKFMFTIIPEPATGPADNEIWYISSDGNVVTPYSTSAFGANIVSNTYEDEHGVITFDNSLTSIGTRAFSSCTSLVSITIPNSITSFKLRAFEGCSSLTSITIPESVTNIGRYTFEDCSSLSSVNIPNGVSSIGSSVFHNCSSLASITIPNNVTSIGSYAF